MKLSRRQFICGTAAAVSSSLLLRHTSAAHSLNAPQMKLGLVTYQWGKDWDLPTLISHCAQSGILGVELRTEHKHAVEPNLTPAQRDEVRKRFADSPVTLVGYGSNAQFHEKDPQRVRQNIEQAKAYVQLMHDCGGSGVKVKPNGFEPDVPHEQTIEQIGRALNQLAAYAADFNQQIRLEVHGRGTDELPNIKAIMDVADHPNVGVCWNSNATDLTGEGLEHNFHLVKNRLGQTVHVRELNQTGYPYPQLLSLLARCDYSGWILLECHSNPPANLSPLTEQKETFEKLLAGLKK